MSGQPRPPKRSPTHSPDAKQREGILTDERIEIDSNIVERAIRPQTTTRKQSIRQQQRWPTVALLQTIKMNGVDPHNQLPELP
ncbi:MAG: transposase [Shinella sp.]|nr:transposase [Shinella sp.]